MNVPRILIGLALAIAGFVPSALGFYYSWQMKALSRVAQAEAQPLTLAALAKSGAGDNLHVQVSDYSLGKPVIDKNGEEWDRVWIPMTAANAPRTKAPTDPVVFFRTTRVRDQAQLDELLKSTNLDALVASTSLKKTYWGSGVSSALYLAYPKMDIEKVTILTEPGMTVPLTKLSFKSDVIFSSSIASTLMLAAGGLMLAGFVGSFLIASHPDRKPHITEAVSKVDRHESGHGITTRYISTIPSQMVNPEEVHKQREVLKTELEQSTHDFKAFSLMGYVGGGLAGFMVVVLILTVMLTSGASACQDAGPLAAACAGLFAVVAFTGIVFVVAGSLHSYLHRASRIQICASGLRWLQGSKPRMAAWTDIASVERVTIDSCPRNTVMATQFGLIGALAVAMSQPDHASLKRTGDWVNLVLHDGERLHFSSGCLTEYTWFAESVYQWHSAESKRFDPSHKFEAMVRTVSMPGRSNRTMLNYGG